MSDDDQNKGRSTRSSAARKLYSVGHDPSPARLGCSQWGTGSHEICRGRPYVVMKKSFRTRVTTGVVLGAVLALSIVDSALAATCAANTFYPGGTGGTSSSCTACPTGTTAAAIPDHTGSRTYCEGIDANYYGTAGNVSSVDAAVTACPYGGTSSASPSTSTAVTDCTPQCGTGTNAEVNAGTCRCEANYYGTPKDTNDAELLVVTQGCTACPSGSTSSAGSAAQSSCNCDASAAPTNGGVGDCTNSLASGSTCQPTCSSRYSVFGTSSCTAGTLTAAKCLANPCDASTAPTNGDVGACTRSLPSGAACQPTCNSGYTVSGTSSCSLGTLTAATCSANPAPAVPKLMLGIILTVVCGLIVSAAVFYVYQRRRRRRLGSSSFRQFVAEFNRGVEMT